MEAEEANQEVVVLFERWLSKTNEILKERIEQLKIGDYAGKTGDDELLKSVNSSMRRMGQAFLAGDISFLERGRFVDMGSGRGYSFGKSIRGSFDIDSGRKRGQGRRPKKWQRALYGRLNDLQGAIGYTMMEQAMEIVKEGIID